MCRSGPLDKLMILTTTINVSSIYSTSIVVMIPIIWLYITVFVVVISFSIFPLVVGVVMKSVVINISFVVDDVGGGSV